MEYVGLTGTAPLGCSRIVELPSREQSAQSWVETEQPIEVRSHALRAFHGHHRRKVTESVNIPLASTQHGETCNLSMHQSLPASREGSLVNAARQRNRRDQLQTA